MPQPSSVQHGSKANATAVTKESYLALAGLLEGNVRNQFARKKNPQGEALRTAGQMYGQQEYVAAYESLKPAHAKVVADMRRVLVRNPELEANRLASEQRKPLAAAKETVEKLRAHAQRVIDGFDSVLRDLENKPAVRVFLKQSLSQIKATPSPSPTDGERKVADAAPRAEAPPTTVSIAGETQVDAPLMEVSLGDVRYRKVPYAAPEKGSLYSVRDKSKGERIIRIVEVSTDGGHAQVEVLEEGKLPKQPIQLAVESLVRQAAKGWCSLLEPVAEEPPPLAPPPRTGEGEIGAAADFNLRLDIQNFGRCCGDIARANIKFDTQLIKDVGDGPFRAGNYEQAFVTFEQIASGFSSAVASSRRTIAEGRRALNDQKIKLSGKEIQERTAAFVRGEQLIHTAEREFSTILEGLRMFLRAKQDSPRDDAK